ncbi:MAG TPA: hypothetical protein EYO48_04155 [Candidatus Marinimicrobia bacterium]|nr:hypothetical protein [Candidatus Neomarinimicrobiota bacterium]
MKKISFSIIAFFLMLCMGTNPLFSQDYEEEASDTTAVEDLEDEIDEAFLEEEGFEEEPDIRGESWFKLPGGLSLRSAGVNLGFYKPSMAYWNDSYGSSAQHPNTPWTVSSSFGMSFLFQAGMRLNLNAENTLWTELEVGFWSGSAELKGTYAEDGTNGTEKIEYSIMPINISVGYSLSDLLLSGMYAGAGFGANKITMTQTQDSDTPKESSGFGTMYHLLVGYDYPLTDQLSLGAELQIALGGHKHSQVSETSDTVPVQTTEQKDISLSGPKILLQLNYLFQTDND